MTKGELKYSTEAIKTSIKDSIQRLIFVLFIELAMQVIIQIFTIRFRFYIIKGIYTNDISYFLRYLNDVSYLFYLNIADLIIMVILFVFFFQFASSVRRMTYFLESNEIKKILYIAGTLIFAGIIFELVGYIVDIVGKLVLADFLLYTKNSINIVTAIVFAAAFYKLSQFMRGCYMNGILPKKESPMLFYSQIILILSGGLSVVATQQFLYFYSDYLLYSGIAVALTFIGSAMFIWGLFKFNNEVKSIQSIYDLMDDSRVGDSHRAPSNVTIIEEADNKLANSTKEGTKSKRKQKSKDIEEIQSSLPTIIVCPKCGTKNPSDSKFCMNCVANLHNNE